VAVPSTQALKAELRCPTPPRSHASAFVASAAPPAHVLKAMRQRSDEVSAFTLRRS
jgi:hypothetical protein